MVYNWQKTLWNYTIDHRGLVYYIIINAAELDCSIVPHWLSRRPAAWRAADFGIIEKPTCSNLHDCCGVILAYLQHTTGFLSLQYINDHLLGAFYCGWRQRYVRYECVSYQSFMKWEPNNWHKMVCWRISCMLLIKPSNRINKYNT